MADIKLKLGTATAATITVASLANAGARQSAEIDNATNLYADYLVSVKVKTGASGTSTTGSIEIYVYGNVNDVRDDGAGATDAPITVANARLIGIIGVAANATTYTRTFSVAQAFGGVLPAKFGVIVKNASGGALDSTAGNHAVTYQGVMAQSA
jgi:hypothetical protein